MISISETNDKISSRKPNPTDDEDVTFFFFYDLVKQLILKRNDIGGKLYYNNTRMDVIFTDKRIIKYWFLINLATFFEVKINQIFSTI